MELKLNNYGRLRAVSSAAKAGRGVQTAENNLSFKGKLPDADYFTKTIQKGVTTFTNAQKITETIDGILGDKYFSSLLNKTNIEIKNDTFSIKNEKLADKVIETLSYPFIDLPRDLMIFVLKPLSKKYSPIKGLAQKALDSGFLKSRIQKAQNQKDIALLREIVNQFSSTVTDGKISVNASAQNLMDNAISGVSKIKQNYLPRDERTMNRMVTSTVSALYSAGDFYNISMLQKDDDKEAKKAKKDRFKQEITRMALSAGLTYLTLGILGNYAKKSVVLNSFIIAGSALISEIISRVAHGVVLHPLTPEQAAKIAQDNKNKNEAKSAKTNIFVKEQPKTISFKSHLIDETPFKSFIDNNKAILTYSPQFIKDDSSINQEATEQKKNNFSVKKALLLAFGTASTVFLLSKKGPLKGAFGAIANVHNKAKDLITTRKYEVNLDALQTKLTNLANLEEGKEISSILQRYDTYIDYFKRNGNVNNITLRKNRFLLPSVYNGFTKIFSTLFQILSAPGRIINMGLDKLLNTGSEKLDVYAKSESVFKKDLAALNEILEKEKTELGVINAIKKGIKNVETATETGELASLSRTLVTAISTYFFVNDYTNKVLIESAGKNVEEAIEERNERIAHKISNFFFNGMLMNLFNSIFKKPLNNSLWQAAIIAGGTETLNEFLVRKSICQPVRPLKSKQEILDYEEKQLKKDGLMGAWSRFFRKITGKKTLTQKAGIDVQQ